MAAPFDEKPYTEQPFTDIAHRDMKVEQLLIAGGYQYSTVDFMSFEQIDLQASAENPARIEHKIELDRAGRYGNAMKAGAKFPAIVLLNHGEPGKLPWIVATGMHRIDGAIMADIEGLPAYLVTEADEERRETLIRLLNSVEGKGHTQDETLIHILRLNQKYGKPLATLAREWHVHPKIVTSAASEQKGRQRARKFGFNLPPGHVAQTPIVALNSIHNDRVFEQALDLYANYQKLMPTQDIKQMASEIRHAHDERSQLGVVAKWRIEAEKRAAAKKVKKGGKRIPPVIRVINAINSLNNQLGGTAIAALNIAHLGNRPGHIGSIDELVGNLKNLKQAIEQVERRSQPPQTPPQPDNLRKKAG